MKENGGPAFPQTLTVGPDGYLTCGWDGHGVGGMALRDYFAAKALELVFAPSLQSNVVAEMAYELADAMLAERAK